MAAKQLINKVGIIGGGVCGTSWAMLFASAGCDVVVYDINPKQLTKCMHDINLNLRTLDDQGMRRGTLSLDEQVSKVHTTTKLSDAVAGCDFVCENVPEILDTKQQVFREIAEHVDNKETVLASATSTIPMSHITGTLMRHVRGDERYPHVRDQTIVAHNTNPVFHLGLVEIVPAPYTNIGITTTCERVLQHLGQKPITLKKEWPGFALNRIQYAVINEAWHLVNDGVLDAKDIDPILTDGLGPRWCFFGPWEIADLNGPRGAASYFQHYGRPIKRVSDHMKRAVDFSEEKNVETTKRIVELARDRVPLDRIDELYALRDEYLTEITRIKRKIDKDQFYEQFRQDKQNEKD